MKSKTGEKYLPLRLAETEYLLKAIGLIPKAEQSNVIHSSLEKRIKAIKAAWEQEERQKRIKQRERVSQLKKSKK